MSFFKRLRGDVNQKPSHGSGTLPSGMQPMDNNLQRRFAKGVQYNMKIVIRGDRNVGKTALFNRIQGHPPLEEYVPTDEIQVCSIQWFYKTTDDVVKVEVWDVVDKGRKKKMSVGLKLTNEELEDIPEASLDSETIDVYKNCHGVIIMFDITKQWTVEYAEREIPKVPASLPILILGNKRDLGEKRQVPEDRIIYFVKSLNRQPGSAEISYHEASMLNGFGLKCVYSYFNLPFLVLQRQTLLLQLERNETELHAMSDELSMLEEAETYDWYMDCLAAKAAGRPPPPSPLTAAKPPPVQQQRSNTLSPSAASPASAAPVFKKVGEIQAEKGRAVSPNHKQPTPAKQQVKSPLPTVQQKPAGSDALSAFAVDDSVEDFLADSGPAVVPSRGVPSARTADSDSEEDNNPLVANFQDEGDEAPVFVSAMRKPVANLPAHHQLPPSALKNTSSPAQSRVSNHLEEPSPVNEEPSDDMDVFLNSPSAKQSSAAPKFVNETFDEDSEEDLAARPNILSVADLDALDDLSIDKTEVPTEEAKPKKKKKKKVVVEADGEEATSKKPSKRKKKPKPDTTYECLED